MPFGFYSSILDEAARAVASKEIEHWDDFVSEGLENMSRKWLRLSFASTLLICHVCPHEKGLSHMPYVQHVSRLLPSKLDAVPASTASKVVEH